MNTKLLLFALTQALAAAADSFRQSAENMSDDDNAPAPTPVPAAANEAPTPTPEVTPQQIANVELDKEGLPWDERIHAGTKTKTQTGTWTKRKKLEDSVRNKVVAELRQKYPEPQAAEPTPPAAPTTNVTPPTAAPATPTLSVPTPAAARTPYTELTDWLAKNTGAGKSLTDEWVKQVFTENNTTLAALADQPAACTEFLKAFRDVLTQMGVAEVA